MVFLEKKGGNSGEKGWYVWHQIFKMLVFFENENLFTLFQSVHGQFEVALAAIGLVAFATRLIMSIQLTQSVHDNNGSLIQEGKFESSSMEGSACRRQKTTDM